CTRRSYFDYW
nr:immunoglobulin heavy chain junction region [Mus musculus]